MSFTKTEKQIIRTRGQITALTSLVALALYRTDIVEYDDDRLQTLRNNILLVTDERGLSQEEIDLLTEGIDNVFRSIAMTLAAAD